MKRFPLVMQSGLYNDFYRLFPDRGARTAALRKCVKRMVEQAKLAGGLLQKDFEAIADGVAEKMKEWEQ